MLLYVELLSILSISRDVLLLVPGSDATLVTKSYNWATYSDTD